MSYDELLKAHKDVWCVFLCYGENDNNNKYIVNSSNKLVMALQAGKPIIVIGNRNLADFCNEYQCGVGLKDWSKVELEKALAKLEKDYEMYCENARRCYETRFDISLFIRDVYSKMSKGIIE